MSDDTQYTPPKAAWNLKTFTEASIDEIRDRRVSCATCPVSMLCQAADKKDTTDGGTGYTCDECGGTGVWVEEPETNHVAKHVLLIDCGAHKFHTKPKGATRRCSLCNGQVMELFVRHAGTNMHYVATEHAKVPVEKRQEVFAKSLLYWLEDARKEREAEEKRLAEREKAAREVVG